MVVGSHRIVHFFESVPPCVRAASPTVPMARGDGKDIVLDDPAIKLEGHLSAFAARVAVEHPTAATGHARGAYVTAHQQGQDGLPCWPPGQGRWLVHGN